MRPPLRQLAWQPRLLLAACALSTLAAPALAAGEESAAKAKENTARKACLAGNVADGIAILADLFLETKDYNYIYNQARCFEQNHRYEDAISRFREFLKKAPNLTEKDRADVGQEMADCQALLQPAATKPTADSAPPAPAASVVTPPAPSPAAADGSPGRGLRIAGLACGAVGVAAIVTGIVFYGRASSLSDQISTSDNPSASDFQSGKNAETAQWVLHSVGAAAVAGGALLYYLGWRASSRAQVSLTPVVAPGFAGLASRGAF